MNLGRPCCNCITTHLFAKICRFILNLENSARANMCLRVLAAPYELCLVSESLESRIARRRRTRLNLFSPAASSLESSIARRRRTSLSSLD